jgi:hypothetical protein
VGRGSIFLHLIHLAAVFDFEKSPSNTPGF